VHGHLRLEHLEEMPGDRLPFAVFVGREVEGVRLAQQLLELADVLLLVGVDDVERREVVLHIDAELAELRALEVRGDVLGALGEVTDVPDRRLHHEVGAEIARDGLGLRRGLDDHQ